MTTEQAIRASALLKDITKLRVYTEALSARSIVDIPAYCRKNGIDFNQFILAEENRETFLKVFNKMLDDKYHKLAVL